MILTHPEIAHTALKAASDAGRSKNTVYLFTDPGEDMSKYSSLQLRPWNDIWSTIDVISLWTWKKISSVDEAKATTAILNYSSGLVIDGCGHYVP